MMRAAAAYSTAIKNTSDLLRHSLRLEHSLDDTGKDLPELVISELSDDEAAELRKTNDGEIYSVT